MTRLVHSDKHSQQIKDNLLHSNKSAVSKTPSTISQIVKVLVDRLVITSNCEGSMKLGTNVYQYILDIF